jgi:hypothetical protein
MLEKVYRSKYNKFLNSKEGRNYYLGMISSTEGDAKKNLDKKPKVKIEKKASQGTQETFAGSNPGAI